MSAHWVIFTCFAWGHLRPESNLAVTLARKFPSIIITCIVDADFAPKALGEIKRNVSLGHDPSLLKRIRLIPLGRALAAMTPELAANFNSLDPRILPHTPPTDVQKIHAAFDDMMQEKAFNDYEGQKWEPVAKPSLLICDLMMGYVVPVLKEKYELPLFMWYVGSAGSLTRMYGSTESGGRGPTYVEECLALENDVERSAGKSFTRLAFDVWSNSPAFKDIIHVKGLPPIYQWEDTPQSTWYPSFYDSVAAGYPLFQMTDGILLPTVMEIEKDAVEGIKEWYCADRPDRQVLCLGPQLPPEYFSPTSGTHKPTQLADAEVKYDYMGSNTLVTTENAKIDPCMKFLDHALEEYGANSAIYISFGSIFFPKREHVEILLERILALEKPMPFAFTTAAPGAFLSDALQVKITESGKGLIVPWAPQQTILAHPALGAIVSHCGGGGTFESLSQGVPVIAWPFIWDQPPHALWMSEVLDTGFELLQIRDGPVKGPALRGGPNGTEITGTPEAIEDEIDRVLRECQGEVGKRKRANAEKVKQAIWEAHQPGGQIDLHLDRLRGFAGV